MQVHTADTDVLVVLIGVFLKLLLPQTKGDIWVAIDVGRNYRLYSIINILCTNLCTRIKVTRTTNASCDFWMRHWMAFGEVTDTFVYLASHPFEPLDSKCRKIEWLIVLVYEHFTFKQSDKEGTVLSKKRHNGKDSTDVECPATTHEEGGVPSFYRGYEYRSTADNSLASRLWL